MWASGFNKITGVSDGIRTHDPRIHNPMLYQLSYAHRSANMIARGAGGTKWGQRVGSSLAMSF